MTQIVQLADIHFGTESDVALKACRGLVRELSPDGLAVCGDLTQRGKRSEFDNARDWLDSFGLPMIATEGNHDTPLLNIYERVTSPFERFEDLFGPFSGPLDLDDTRIVSLNTARGWQARKNWAEGSVNLEQLEGAISSANGDGHDHQILICHHPFLSHPEAPLRTETRRGGRASRALAASRVKLLLTGHVHAPSAHLETNEAGDYLAVAAGTLSTRLRATPPSFNLIEFNDAHILVTAFVLHGHEFKPRPVKSWNAQTLAPESGAG